MHAYLRPYVTTGIAVAGAGVLAIAPVVATSPQLMAPSRNIVVTNTGVTTAAPKDPWAIPFLQDPLAYLEKAPVSIGKANTAVATFIAAAPEYFTALASYAAANPDQIPAIISRVTYDLVNIDDKTSLLHQLSGPLIHGVLYPLLPNAVSDVMEDGLKTMDAVVLQILQILLPKPAVVPVEATNTQSLFKTQGSVTSSFIDLNVGGLTLPGANLDDEKDGKQPQVDPLAGNSGPGDPSVQRQLQSFEPGFDFPKPPIDLTSPNDLLSSVDPALSPPPAGEEGEEGGTNTLQSGQTNISAQGTVRTSPLKSTLIPGITPGTGSQNKSTTGAPNLQGAVANLQKSVNDALSAVRDTVKKALTPPKAKTTTTTDSTGSQSTP